MSASLLRTLAAAFHLFDRRAKWRLAALLAMMVVGASLEALGTAVIVPFVALINDSSYLETQPLLRRAFVTSGLSDPNAFITASALLLLVFFIFKNLYLALLARSQFGFIYSEMPRYSERLFLTYIHRPLAMHVQTNNSEMIRNVGNEVFMFFTNFLIPAMTLLTELLVLLAILVALLVIAPVPALVAIVLLGSMTKGFYSLVRAKVRRYGDLQQRHNAERIKWITQAMSSVKESKVLGRERYFVERFREHEEQFSLSAEHAMMLNQTPRLFIETIAFAALFGGVAAALLVGQERNAVLPILALFAIAAMRLLPSLNRVLLSITRMAYYRPAAKTVIEACSEHRDVPAQPPKAEVPSNLAEWRELRFSGVSFSYLGSTAILDNVDFEIQRGSKVALIGPSGSGKTTMADLVLGLLQPTGGRILLDGSDIAGLGRQWQSRLAYIPQSVYLLDDSIRRNVAFAMTDADIDDERVWKALRLASLDQFVAALPGQLDASVGENGSKLSGGQRQRLGIARALYDEPDLIVLDEATSALDDDTEREIADTLDGLAGSKTLLIVAHRPETIRRCDRKFSVLERRFVE